MTTYQLDAIASGSYDNLGESLFWERPGQTIYDNPLAALCRWGAIIMTRKFSVGALVGALVFCCVLSVQANEARWS